MYASSTYTLFMHYEFDKKFSIIHLNMSWGILVYIQRPWVGLQVLINKDFMSQSHDEVFCIPPQKMQNYAIRQ